MPEDTEDTRPDERPCLFKFITAITRVWGLLTVGVLWVLAVEAIRDKTDHSFLSWYLIAVSPLITFWEVLWIFDKVACCAHDDSGCCKVWHAFLWFDGWKKTIVYVLLSIPCFIKGFHAKWALLYGIVLIILGLFYLLKSIKYCKCVEKRRNKSQDDQTSKLVKEEHQPASTSSQPRRETNPHWPPPGYVEGPDGSLHAVSVPKEDQPVKAKKENDNFKQKYGAMNEETRDWPPPGYEAAPDGSLYAVFDEPEQSHNRRNPFDSSSGERHENPKLTQSTDSYNPFDSSGNNHR